MEEKKVQGLEKNEERARAGAKNKNLSQKTPPHAKAKMSWWSSAGSFIAVDSITASATRQKNDREIVSPSSSGRSVQRCAQRLVLVGTGVLWLAADFRNFQNESTAHSIKK